MPIVDQDAPDDADQSGSFAATLNNMFTNPQLMGIFGGLGGIAGANQVSRLPIPKFATLAGLVSGTMGGANYAQKMQAAQQANAGTAITNTGNLFHLNQIRDAFNLPQLSLQDILNGKGGGYLPTGPSSSGNPPNTMGAGAPGGIPVSPPSAGGGAPLVAPPGVNPSLPGAYLRMAAGNASAAPFSLAPGAAPSPGGAAMSAPSAMAPGASPSSAPPTAGGSMPMPQPNGSMAPSPPSPNGGSVSVRDLMRPIIQQATFGVQPTEYAKAVLNAQLMPPGPMRTQALQAAFHAAGGDVTENVRQGSMVMMWNPYTNNYGVAARNPNLSQNMDYDPQSGRAFLVPGVKDAFGTLQSIEQGAKAQFEPQTYIDPNTNRQYTTNRGALASGQPLLTGLSPLQESSQTTRGGELEKYGQELQDDAASATQGNFLVDQMRRESQSWNMGQFANVAGDARAYLQGFQQMLGLPANPALNQPLGDYQAFRKNALQMTTQATRAVSSRAAVQEMQMIQNALPQPTMSQQAFGQIADQLQGVNDFRIAKQQASDAWRSRPGGDGTLSGFEGTWNKNISPGAFLVHRMSAQDWQGVAANLQSSPSGRAYLQQIVGELKFGQANGLFNGVQ